MVFSIAVKYVSGSTVAQLFLVGKVFKGVSHAEVNVIAVYLFSLCFESLL